MATKTPEIERDAVEDAEATFEELAQIELDFEDVETQIIAQQYLLSLPLYEKRAAITKKIKNFWPLAFEMSPVEIDSCIQPTDSEIFATALDDFSVTRFEIPTTATLASGNLADYGIPRSVAFTFKFAENEWFEDTVIEKKFWWRRASDAFTGLVSDPVKIHWKPGKDLTHGLLDAACKLAEAVEKAGPGANIEELKESKELTQKVEKTTEGSQSFFAWFGYIGRFISEDESKAAWRLHDEKRAKAKRGELKLGPGAQPEEAFEPAGIMDNEIFPGGEALAMELANEFWPGALSYFTNAQEDNEMSELDFEEDEDEDDESEVPNIRDLVKDWQKKDGPAAKRRKT